MIKHSNDIFYQLKSWCETEGFMGWDPFDGLNSRIFNSTPLKYSRFFRLLWIQFFKRSPINFRKLAVVPKGFNPQALGLFLSTYSKYYKLTNDAKALDILHQLSEQLIKQQSKGWSGACWGYNFDWQARAFRQPAFSPTIVPTTFAVYGLLDANEILQDPKIEAIARSSALFVLNDLNKTTDPEGNFAYSYSPLDQTVVYNASLLASKLLARLSTLSDREELLANARKSVHFCVSNQQNDGSWAYGTKPYHQWIDSFHTGYNLECIQEYQKYSGDNNYNEAINKGLDYYIKTFFQQEEAPWYYSDRKYPVDINCPAQLISTLYNLGKLDDHKKTVDKTLQWTFDHLLNKNGYFYYQKRKYFTSRIPYIRWAQAWMMYALILHIDHYAENK